MPRAMSSPSEPVEIASTSMMRSLAPSRMIEPLPKFLSIWASAASSALCLSMSAPSTIRSDGLSIDGPLFHELHMLASCAPRPNPKFAGRDSRFPAKCTRFVPYRQPQRPSAPELLLHLGGKLRQREGLGQE